MRAADAKKIKENKGLVVDIARKLHNCGVDTDDLIQVGMIGLMQAVERFDKSNGTKFSTFAYHYIRGFMLREIRNNRVQRGQSEQWGIDDEGKPFDTADKRNPEYSAETMDMLCTLLPRLNEQERKVITMRFGLNDRMGMTQAKISELLGVSKQRVEQVEQKALLKMREELLERHEIKY